MLLLTTSLRSVLSRVDAVAAADTSTVLNACCLLLLLLPTVQLMSRCPSQARFPRRSDPHLVLLYDIQRPAAEADTVPVQKVHKFVGMSV